MWYKLDKENNPVPCEAIEFSEWEKDNMNQRVLKQDHIDNVLVSTVFLGLDHGFGSKAPVLWETMIFGGQHDSYTERYDSYEEACLGHQRAIDLFNVEADGN